VKRAQGSCRMPLCAPATIKKCRLNTWNYCTQCTVIQRWLLATWLVWLGDFIE